MQFWLSAMVLSTKVFTTSLNSLNSSPVAPVVSCMRVSISLTSLSCASVYALPVSVANSSAPCTARSCTLAQRASVALRILSEAYSTLWYACVYISPAYTVLISMRWKVASLASFISSSSRLSCWLCRLACSCSMYLALILAAVLRSTASISSSCFWV